MTEPKDLQGEFIQSLKALMIRYSVHLIEDWNDHGQVCFLSDNTEINIEVRDLCE